ncbi:MAG: hypothetical protein RI918_1020 [Pseudomonadota bacterium]|jgi:hypothetical protein
MKKLNSQPTLKLDAEEKALLDVFEAGKMNASSLSKASLEKLKLAAAATIFDERSLEKPSNLAKS